MMTALKSFLYFILAAGLGAGYVPFVLLPKSPQVKTGGFAFLAFPLWLLGGFVILWCFWDFTFKGRGTPLPLDPPKELVDTGPYRYIRNPIYVGVLVIILGYFLWFKTVWLIVYAVIAFLGVHLFVIFYEEPHLRKTFGAAYEDYLKRVPRWLPTFK
jgi:protein-S-isoprenylcysteine O-methyltransferase Ste14